MIALNTRELVYQGVQEKIRDGVYAAGGPLPSLRVLSDEYDTSVGTIRQALDRLRVEGLVISHHGKGNYVAAAPQRTRNVMLLAELHGDLFGTFANAFSSVFSEHPDLQLLLEKPPHGLDHGPPEVLEARVRQLIQDGNLDAIFFDGTEFHNTGFLAQYLDQVDVFCFYNDAKLSEFSCPCVASDWFHGGYIGVRHLVDQGCRQPLVITHALDNRQPCNVVFRFLEGCRKAAVDLGIELRTFHHQAEAPDYADAFEVLMKGIPEIDGLFALADFRLRPLYPVLRKLGRVVGEDIAALGYYDTPWAQAMDPALSSINVRPDQIIDDVCRMFFENTSGSRQLRVPPELVVRESSNLNRKRKSIRGRL